MKTFLFNEYKYSGNDLLESFLRIIEAYKAKNMPIVIFKEPILYDKYLTPDKSRPILDWDMIEYMNYTFIGNGFEAILSIQFPTADEYEKFEAKELKGATFAHYSYSFSS